jgi:glutathione S-transferase
LWWLHQKHPQAGLLPEGDGWAQAQHLSDLFWVSSAWHPSVRANMMPIRWTTGDPAPVRERGKQLIEPLLERLEARLALQPWWYGAAWSILDTYLYWCYTTAEEGEYDLSGLSAIADHRGRVAEHPAFIRAIAREDAARERMA